jgi:hypothetical protein
MASKLMRSMRLTGIPSLGVAKGDLMNIRSASFCIRTTLLTVILMLAGPGHPARADGGGCTYYGIIGTGKGDVPYGELCIGVFGDGTYIHDMKAGWEEPQRCNWRIDWVIYYEGKTWWRDNGPAHGCTLVYGSRIRGKGYAPGGSEVCAELYDSAQNKRIDAACAAIEN